MMAALTTSAVINCSFNPPEKAVMWTEFAPHYRSFTPRGSDHFTDRQRQMIHEHNVLALEAEAKMRAEKDTHAQ